jgi:hypothetical protein
VTVFDHSPLTLPDRFFIDILPFMNGQLLVKKRSGNVKDHGHGHGNGNVHKTKDQLHSDSFVFNRKRDHPVTVP